MAGRPTHPELEVVLRAPPSGRASSQAAPTLADMFREHGAYVARVAHALLGRSEDVDDVVQETFMDAIRGLGQLRDPGAARGWLRIIAVRRARARLRRRRLRIFFGFDEAPAYLDVAAPGVAADDRVLLARIYELLDRLPSNVRVAWTMRYVEGERLDDIAAACECSVPTIKRRIAAAERHLEEVSRDG